MADTLNFDDYGLALGLISYSFKTDWKILFDEAFKNDLFSKHRKNLGKFSPPPHKMDKALYRPQGYKLFGNNGLAILSLIDDYAFCNRIFNDNHTHNTTAKYNWSSKIITGVSDSKNYLYDKAKATFLRKGNQSDNKRYPFIGIMKLKVDHRLLHGKGIKFTFLVKKAISNSVPEHDENIHFDHIIIDCFDNDELSVIAFSNSVYVIRQFMEDIRGLKNEQIVALVSLEEEKKSFKYYRNHEDFLNNRELDKHVFMFCHINLGYDINYLRKGKDQKVFLVRQELIDKELFTVEQLANIQNLDFICETKPGHRAEFEKSMIRRFKILGIEVTLNSIITGGSSTYMTLSAEKIGVIEKLCTMPCFYKNVRRVKISMRPIIPLCNESNVKEPHERDMEEPDLFNLKFIKKMKGLLKQCGISKIVRERLLSIYRLYNESAGNMLQATYFKELKEALRDMSSFLEDFLSNEKMPKQELETSLTTAINAFEEAFNNRLHVKGFSNKLEYNGSVQQYLTSFDFLYKQIIRAILPSDLISGFKPFQTAFATITGYEKVTSERMNLQLNINQITYPEFFATTVWKEAANHHKPLFENYSHQNDPNFEKCRERFEIWKNFIKADMSYERTKSYLDKDSYSSYCDETYRIVHYLLHKEFLNHLVSDQIVFHFGFQRNFELFWHFYWKIFLQTSETYLRMGEIDRTYFIYMLLRIMMVGVSDSSRVIDVSVDPDKKSNNEQFLLDHRNKPFDSLIADLWLSHYDKVFGYMLPG